MKNVLSVSTYCKPNVLFTVMYNFFMSPKEILINKRFNKKALQVLLDAIVFQYKKAIVAPGENGGMIGRPVHW